jgi:WD40 repeat protein
MAFSPDGSLLVSTGDRSLTVWSCGPQYEPLVERVGQSYRCVAFSPDGRTLALGADDGTIRLWDMPAARERMVWHGHDDLTRSVAFSPDGKLLASSAQDGSAVLWDAIRGTEIRTLHTRGPSPVRFTAFSPDGRTLGLSEVTWRPEDVLLMDVETGAIRTRLTGHRLGTNALAFSPNGRTVATAGVDRCIKLWDLASGKELITLREGVGYVKSIVFSPDGAWLAFSGNDAMVRLWGLEGQRSHPLQPRSSAAHGPGIPS